MKNKGIIGFIVALLLGGGGAFVAQDQLSGASDFSFGRTIASTTAVSTGNNILLATSSARDIVTLHNNSSSTVYLNFGLPATAGEGYALTASSTLIISRQNGGNIYTRSSIQGITTLGSSDVTMIIKHIAE